jgi:acyl-coenzyme A synthetase/AMP-(fatty) acid ligase
MSSPRSCASTSAGACRRTPIDIAFVEQLPKTPSGKIPRFLLRNAEKAEAHDAAKSQ